MAYSFDALNVLTMLMSAYFSAVALTLYILSFTTACSEYNVFHEEVSKAIANGDINVSHLAKGEGPPLSSSKLTNREGPHLLFGLIK